MRLLCTLSSNRSPRQFVVRYKQSVYCLGHCLQKPNPRKTGPLIFYFRLKTVASKSSQRGCSVASRKGNFRLSISERRFPSLSSTSIFFNDLRVERILFVFRVCFKTEIIFPPWDLFVPWVDYSKNRRQQIRFQKLTQGAIPQSMTTSLVLPRFELLHLLLL